MNNQVTESELKLQPPYPWLASVWERFVQSVQRDRVAHAILLVGEHGVGCLDLSIAMAQALLCISPKEGVSCLECKSCQLLQAGTHPDLHTVFLEGKASVIKIDQIRALIEVTSKTAQQGGRKIIVISPAEAMNANAANALLKSLEEPSGDCLYILVAEQPAFLPATIRSRCSHLAVPLPEKGLALEWLQRNKVTEASAKLDAVGGRPLKVLEWLELGVWKDQQKFRDDLVTAVSSGGGFVACVKSYLSLGAEWIVEQVLISVYTATKMSLKVEAQDSSSDILAKALSQFQTEQLIRFHDQLLDKKRLLLKGANLNPQLAVEELALALQDMAQARLR